MSLSPPVRFEFGGIRIRTWVCYTLPVAAVTFITVLFWVIILGTYVAYSHFSVPVQLAWIGVEPRDKRVNEDGIPVVSRDAIGTTDESKMPLLEHAGTWYREGCEVWARSDFVSGDGKTKITSTVMHKVNTLNKKLGWFQGAKRPLNIPEELVRNSTQRFWSVIIINTQMSCLGWERKFNIVETSPVFAPFIIQ